MDILSERDIVFDVERHLYFRNGFPLPSVTQILPFFMDDHVPEDTIRKAAERGHRVHKWIEAHCATATGNISRVEESDMPYCRAWLDFVEKTGFELAYVDQQPAVELFIHHNIYQYVGRLDLIGYLRRIPRLADELTLIDAKTVAKISPTTALQTAAYMQAINPWLKQFGFEIKHRWAAHLLPSGTCKREAYEDHRGDFATFLNYLGVTRWETKVGMRRFLEDPFTAPPDAEVAAISARF